MIATLSESYHNSSLKGFLIDLDLAKELPEQIPPPTTPPTQRRRTGTMLFMAIEILKGAAPRHTWRHDLESFLYVLIWLCIHHGRKSNEVPCTLLEECWSAKGAANNKLVQMSQEQEWATLVGWFAPSLHEPMLRVARAIRDVLFPALKGEIGAHIGTGSNRDAIYAAILTVVQAGVSGLSDLDE